MSVPPGRARKRKRAEDVVEVCTSSGVVGVSTARLQLDTAIEPPPCDHPERLAPLLGVAALLVAHVPDSSASKIKGAVKRWKEFLLFIGLHGTMADWRVVVAFIVVRCCPPVSAELPPFVDTPVLPSTAASDVDCCNKAARLGVEGMSPYDGAFSDFRVSALLHNIKARMPRLKTKKKPLLFSAVEAFWCRCEKNGSTSSIRDGFAAVLALVFGTRASELIQMKTEDIEVIHVYDKKSGKKDRLALRVTFRNVKTRQSIFSTHDPFVVTSAHPLLMRAFSAFDDKVEFIPGHTIFRSDNGQDKPLSRDWLDRIAKSIDPETSPHCFRVGLATELWATGVDILDIMAIGRWGSMGAILYIVGSIERQVKASDRMGGGRLVFDSGELHRSLGTSLTADNVPSAPTKKWAKVKSVLLEEGVEAANDYD